METVKCILCGFEECEVVRRKSKEHPSRYDLMGKCYDCGQYLILSEEGYADLYARMEAIPVDDKPSTAEQRAADRRRYYQMRPAALLLREGISADNAGDWKRALGKLKAAVGKNPNSSEARFYLTAGNIELAKWQDAAKAAQEALQIAPADDTWRPRLLFALGDSLVMLSRDAEALQVLEQSLQYEARDRQLDAKSIREKIQLLQAHRGDEIRADTAKDPRYAKPAKGLLARLLGM